MVVGEYVMMNVCFIGGGDGSGGDDGDSCGI